MGKPTRRLITWVLVFGAIVCLIIFASQRHARVPRLIHQLATGSPEQRSAAVARLVDLQTLPEALKGQPRWVQDRAVSAIALVATGPALQQLAGSLYVFDDPVAARAKAYMASEGPSAIGAFVAGLQDKDSHIRDGCADPLKKIGAPAVPAVIRLIDSYDGDARGGAVGVLTDIGAPATAKLIAVMLAQDSRVAAIIGNVTPPGQKSEAPAQRAKTSAQSALENMKGPAVVPIVTGLIPSSDEKLRAKACSMLGVILDKIVASVDAPTGRTKYLATLPPEAAPAIPALTSRLAGDSSVTVRRSAAQALGKLGKTGQSQPVVVSALIARLDKSVEAGGSVRAAVAEALGTIASTTAAAPLANALVNSREGAAEQIAVALERLGPPAIPAVVSVIANPDTEVRRLATHTLASIGTRAAAGPLASRLSDSDLIIRRTAAQALQGVATMEVVPALAAALSDSDWQVYDSAARALTRVGGPAAPALVSLLAQDDPRINRTAARALQRIGPPAVGVVIGALSSADAHTRQWAAITIGGMSGAGMDQASALLLSAATGLPARMAAADALGRTGLPAALPPLQQAYSDSNAELRIAVLRALANLNAYGATATLAKGLSDSSTAVREVALGLLKSWDAPDATKILQANLSSSDADTRRRTAIALAFEASPVANELMAAVEGSVAAGVGATLGAPVRTNLEEVVKDAADSTPLRLQAVVALGYLGMDESLPVLEPLLQPSNPLLKPSAHAIAGIGWAAYLRAKARETETDVRQVKTPVQTKGINNPAVQALFDMFMGTNDEPVRLETAAALTLVGPVPIETLLDALVNPATPSAVREWIPGVIGLIGSDASVPLSAKRGTVINDPVAKNWCEVTMDLVGDAQSRELLDRLPAGQGPDPAVIARCRAIMERIRQAR